MSSRERAPEAELGLLDATMIGMGAMIGAGIFVLTGLAAEVAGPAAIVVFGLNGVVTAFTGLSYAELAASIPKSGGGYAFVREIFGDVSSFLMGWMLWFAYMIAGALYALGFAPNFIELLHVYGIVPPPGQVGAVALPVVDVGLGVSVLLSFVAVFLLVALNAVSTAASGSIETVFTATKVTILLVFVAFGLASPMFSTAEFQPLFPESRGAFAVLPAMGLTFIAFEGYDLITTVTEEVKNPRRNIPRAIFVSLAATVIVYLAVVTVAVGTLGAGGLAAAGEAGIAQAATEFMPTGLPVIQNGGAIIVFGAVFSTLTALNAVVIASSRIAFSMGREGQLLPSFGHIHHRYGTPFVAILVSAVVMLGSVALPTKSAGNMSSLFFLLSFVVVNVAAIRLRRERPNMNRPYEMPFYPVPPVVGVVLNLVLTGVLVRYLVRTDPLALGLSVGWILLGGLLYFALEVVRSPEETRTDAEATAEDD
ncbi:cationic amino acid:proton symporter, ABT family (TC 2.A.3.6.1) [Halopelagius inordinatus]|uniref:Cationic amino acid:proton symporter, ABT family (TC 2.A.3.6.1) n=1 Tax=Halopelagius inordinatus TaxID=553467 RepID=A0A1I2LUN2_9EURY|nr:APC family permease [Halopelagius inordinatus]SFF82903.1 cationic amino acid:proton symporter, ABT family (TC 2.A.3.6.1) [Halopelagius inordinatus]